MEHTGMENLTVTERAAQRIGDILRREPPGTMLRLSVEGGGCSGFQYKFDMDRAQAPDDVVIARDGALVLIGAAFRVNNPKATASCGCGTSFAL
jgi:Fe-S cluster assembly iron-binding protein IscA